METLEYFSPKSEHQPVRSVWYSLGLLPAISSMAMSMMSARLFLCPASAQPSDFAWVLSIAILISAAVSILFGWRCLFIAIDRAEGIWLGFAASLLLLFVTAAFVTCLPLLLFL